VGFQVGPSPFSRTQAFLKMQAPVLVLNASTKRETGREAQLNNIMAAKAVAGLIRTCLGPKSMLKMILDPMGGIVLTNDGNAILREIDVTHPAAKSIIELSRAQDENVGDGTTSVVILAGEMLAIAEPFLEKQIHPTVIIRGFFKALEDLMELLDKFSLKMDPNNRSELIKVVQSCIGTKFVNRWSDLMCNLAMDAVLTVTVEQDGRKEIDIKRYARVEKIPGGEIEESCVLRGIMLNKDVTHPKMRRRIENPRILLLDCNLEYKKGESQTSVEILKEDDFTALLKIEEDYIARICNDIIKFKPDLVITEKGVSDLAQHYFVKHNITAIRRVRKTDNNRIARACGATIVNRTDEIQESDIGTDCGLFEIRKIGDEYFTFLVDCKNPKACTILLRGASKDVLNEVERNLMDAMNVARNVAYDPRLVPGGGAIEMALSQSLSEKSKSIEGVEQWPYRAVANALEVIPRTLSQNCGANVVRTLTELRAKHAVAPQENSTWGVDGNKGVIADMRELGVWEPFAVKAQTLKTAIEAACILLRVDDVVSGISKKKDQKAESQPVPEQTAEE
jgi:T-complex protein 1 subunit gamma